MKCWSSILTLTFGTTRTAELSDPSAGRTLPQGYSLVLISVRGWVDSKATECWQKDEYTWKFPRNLPRIKIGTSRLVAQCLQPAAPPFQPEHINSEVICDIFLSTSSVAVSVSCELFVRQKSGVRLSLYFNWTVNLL